MALNPRQLGHNFVAGAVGAANAGLAAYAGQAGAAAVRYAARRAGEMVGGNHAGSDAYMEADSTSQQQVRERSPVREPEEEPLLKRMRPSSDGQSIGSTPATSMGVPLPNKPSSKQVSTQKEYFTTTRRDTINQSMVLAADKTTPYKLIPYGHFAFLMGNKFTDNSFNSRTNGLSKLIRENGVRPVKITVTYSNITLVAETITSTSNAQVSSSLDQRIYFCTDTGDLTNPFHGWKRSDTDPLVFDQPLECRPKKEATLTDPWDLEINLKDETGEAVCVGPGQEYSFTQEFPNFNNKYFNLRFGLANATESSFRHAPCFYQPKLYSNFDDGSDYEDAVRTSVSPYNWVQYLTKNKYWTDLLSRKGKDGSGTDPIDMIGRFWMPKRYLTCRLTPNAGGTANIPTRLVMDQTVTVEWEGIKIPGPRDYYPYMNHDTNPCEYNLTVTPPATAISVKLTGYGVH